MPIPDSSTRCVRCVRFGAFELNAATGQLSKQGAPVKLQSKPLQILEALLERAGELVTRAELCEKLWPGTSVDFESSLNTAINRLRSALGDSSEAPFYIETLPRLGYRFICPVSRIEPDEPRVSQPGYWLKRPDRGMPIALSISVIALLFIYFKHFTADAKRVPSFHQLTFRAGAVESARFLPGAKGAIYSAREASSLWRTAVVNLDGSASRILGFVPALLASVSQQGKLALLARNLSEENKTIQLASVSQTADFLQTLADGTRAADWLPNGNELAVVRAHGSEAQVEFPRGHVVYTSPGFIDCLRVSPRGNQIAFLEHLVRDDDGGYVRTVDQQGRTHVLTKTWSSAEGLAWSPSGDEVWFTASTTGAARALYAVSTSGSLRQISQTPSSLRLFDISNKGQVLITTEDLRSTLAAQLATEIGESDVPELDAAHVDDISRDGELILFTQCGDRDGQHYSAYTLDRKTRRAARLGAGRGLALSPDKRSALIMDPQDRTRLILTVIKTGESRQIPGNGYVYQWAKFLPDGSLLVGGAFPQEPLTICRQPRNGGKPACLHAPPYMDNVEISPGGSAIAGMADNQVVIVNLKSSASRRLAPGHAAMPLAWTRDGNSLFLLMGCDAGYRIVKLDLATSKITAWKTIAANETPGFAGLTAAVAAPEADAYAYTARQDLSRLYLVEGW